MKITLPAAVAAALASLALFGTAHATNLISNGSFETPVVSPGGFENFTVGTNTLTGWNVIGPSGLNVSIVSGVFAQNGVTFEAEDGAQWLDLTGDGSNSSEAVSQTLATTAGHQYQLSFFIGNTTGGGIFGTTSTVDVSLNGTPTFTDTNSNIDATALNWQEFTQTFVATGASTTLAFANADPGGDNNNGLDNVGVVDLGPISTTVPEPVSLAIFGMGLAGLGVIRYRRRKPA